MMRLTISFVCAAVLLAASSAHAQFTLEELNYGSLGDPYDQIEAQDINRFGQVIGYGAPSKYAGEASSIATGWFRGEATLVGVPDPSFQEFSVAVGVNASGVAVGTTGAGIIGPPGCRLEAPCIGIPKCGGGCGADGNDYTNICEARAAGTTIVSDFRCDAVDPQPNCRCDGGGAYCEDGDVENNRCSQVLAPGETGVCWDGNCYVLQDVLSFSYCGRCVDGIYTYETLAATFEGGAPNTLFPITEEGNTSDGFAINDSGTVVGTMFDSMGNQVAFLQSPGGSPTPISSDFAEPVAINNSDVVLMTTSSGAAVWNGGVLTPLGDLGGGGSTGHDINESGQVVGYSFLPSGDIRGFLVTPQNNQWFADTNNDGFNDYMTEVEGLGGPGSEAMAINDVGQIVGQGELPNGDFVAFLYLPADDLGLTAGTHDLRDLVNDVDFDPYALPVEIAEGGLILMQNHLLTPNGYVPPEPPTLFETGAEFPYSAETADPVNTFTGEFIYRPEADIQIGGAIPLRFHRYYASNLAISGVVNRIGTDWSHNYAWEIRSTGDESIKVVSPTGYEVNFVLQGGNWVADSDTTHGMNLVEDSNGYRVYSARHDWIFVFDFEGLLMAIRDRAGNEIDLTYNGTELSEVTDGTRSLLFAYTSDGKIASVSDGTTQVGFGYDGPMLTSAWQLDGATRYEYAAGQLEAVVEPSGDRPWTNEYTNSKVVRQVAGAGHEITYQYDTQTTTVSYSTGPRQDVFTHADGALVSLRRGDEQPKTMQSDGQGRRAVVQTPQGDVTLEYDSLGELSAYTLANGRSFQKERSTRDIDGLEVLETDAWIYPGGARYELGRDQDGRLTSITDPLGDTWNYTFDSEGHLTRTEIPGGAAWGFTVHPDGNLASVTDPAQNAVTYEWTAADRIRSVTYPDGTSREFTYDLQGRLATQTDENGLEFTYERDADGNVSGVTTSPSVGLDTQYGYDANNRMTSISRGARTTNIEYTAFDAIASIVDGEGIGIVYEYGANGRVASVADSVLDQTISTYAYDADGNVSSMTDGEGNVTNLTWQNDLLATITDANGNAHQITYDERALFDSFSVADGVTTSFAWDAMGKLMSMTHGDTTVQYEYTGGHVSKRVDANGAEWTIERDGSLRPAAFVDPAGGRVELSYDARNRVSQKNLADLGTLTVTYEPDGSLRQKSYSDGTVIDYDYDEAGRLVQANGVELGWATRGELTSTNDVSVAYDLGGRMTSMISPQESVDYVYDTRGRLRQVLVGDVGVTLVRDLNDDIVEVQRTNGVNSSYDYDGLRTLTSLVEEANGSSLSSIAISRNGAGKMISAQRDLPLDVELTEGAIAYTYDIASRVEQFEYDSLGRRTSDDQRAYTWDLASRLIEVSGDVEISMDYDAFDRIVERRGVFGTEEFIWSYATERPSIVAIIVDGDRWEYVRDPDGALLYALKPDGTPVFYHFDEVGNVLFLTDQDGNITDRYAYTPFGVQTGAEGTTYNPFRFSGRFSTVAHGPTLYQMGRRSYDAATQRFMSRDPYPADVHPLAANPYQYAYGDPLRYIDWSGESPQSSEREALGNTGSTIGWATWIAEKTILDRRVTDFAVSNTHRLIREAGGSASPRLLQAVVRFRHVEDIARTAKSVADPLGKGITVVTTAIDGVSAVERSIEIRDETERVLIESFASTQARIQSINEMAQEAKALGSEQHEFLLARETYLFNRERDLILQDKDLAHWQLASQTAVNILAGLTPPHVQLAFALTGATK